MSRNDNLSDAQRRIRDMRDRARREGRSSPQAEEIINRAGKATEQWDAVAIVQLEAIANGEEVLVQFDDGANIMLRIPTGVPDCTVVTATVRDRMRRVHIVQAPHERFTREGPDLHAILPVDQGALQDGGVVEVETLSRKLALTIRPGTKAGTRIRLAGQGMPMTKGPEHGDLYVTIQETR